MGKPVSKWHLSHWIVGGIALAYTSKGLQHPAGLHAHSTRGRETLWAVFNGVSIQEVHVATRWVLPYMFFRFFRLNVTTPTFAHPQAESHSEPGSSLVKYHWGQLMHTGVSGNLSVSILLIVRHWINAMKENLRLCFSDKLPNQTTLLAMEARKRWACFEWQLKLGQSII